MPNEERKPCEKFDPDLLVLSISPRRRLRSLIVVLTCPETFFSPVTVTLSPLSSTAPNNSKALIAMVRSAFLGENSLLLSFRKKSADHDTRERIQSAASNSRERDPSREPNAPGTNGFKVHFVSAFDVTTKGRTVKDCEKLLDREVQFRLLIRFGPYGPSSSRSSMCFRVSSRRRSKFWRASMIEICGTLE